MLVKCERYDTSSKDESLTNQSPKICFESKIFIQQI